MRWVAGAGGRRATHFLPPHALTSEPRRERRSGPHSRGVPGVRAAAVVLNVDDRALAEVEHLIKVLLRFGQVDGDEDLVGDAWPYLHCDRRSVQSRQAELGDLAFEDRPGLRGPVSERRRLRPRAPTLGRPTPMHLRIQQRDEAPGVAVDEGSVGIVDAIDLVCFHRCLCSIVEGGPSM